MVHFSIFKRLSIQIKTLTLNSIENEMRERDIQRKRESILTFRRLLYYYTVKIGGGGSPLDFKKNRIIKITTLVNSEQKVGYGSCNPHVILNQNSCRTVVLQSLKIGMGIQKVPQYLRFTVTIFCRTVRTKVLQNITQRYMKYGTMKYHQI